MPVIAVLVCIMFFLGGTTCGAKTERRFNQVEAVKRGHAAWVVQPDGSTMFVWAGEEKK